MADKTQFDKPEQVDDLDITILKLQMDVRDLTARIKVVELAVASQANEMHQQTEMLISITGYVKEILSLKK